MILRPAVFRLLFACFLPLCTACAAPAATEAALPVPVSPSAACATAAPTAAPSPSPTPLPAPTPFTIVWLSDTQLMAANEPETFQAVTGWIAKNAAEQNIVAVLHSGDMVQSVKREFQWQNMAAAFALLPKGLTVVTAAGNHDMVAIDDTTYYTQYRPDTETDPARRSPDGNCSYTTLSAGGMDLLILSMSFKYESDSLDWAEGVLSDHPNHLCLLLTHSYLDPHGALSSSGKALYARIVSPHENVRLVLCGHLRGASRSAAAFDGDGDGAPDRTVYQMMFNLQDDPDGHSYLRLLRFDPESGKIQVSTYSPVLDDFGYYDTGADAFVIPDTF